MSLSASCQEENLSLQVVKTSILNEETRRKDKSALFESEANVAQNLGRGRSKHRSPDVRHVPDVGLNLISTGLPFTLGHQSGENVH